MDNHLQFPYYRSIGRECEVFEHAFRNGLPLLLKGPTGSGKSRFVEHMAARLGRELITISCHEETSAVDIVGRYLISNNETLWQDGPLARAVRMGAVVYLDEIAEARPDTLVSIHALTDHRRTLYIERLGETLVAPPEFMLVASFNPGYQQSGKELKPSTRQRFVGLSFDYPESDVEIEIVSVESKVPKETASRLISIARKIRSLVEMGLSESASTRLLIDAGKLIATGLPARLACAVAITEPLTDDKDIRAALNDIIALFL